MPPVKAAPVNPIELADRLVEAAASAGFRIETMGTREGCPMPAFTRRTPGARPRIYLSSGIHGDEPAPPLALLEMIEAGVFDSRAVWAICPLLNPEGLARGTRENAAGVDLNRDYRDPKTPEVRAHIAWLRRQPRFDVTLCLHEDWESTGFYLYEQNPDGRASLAQAILDAVEPACPIDRSPLIDGREASGGIIRPPGTPEERPQWPEAIYLRAHHMNLGYTVESPSAFPLDVRIRAIRLAAEAAIAGTVAAFRPVPPPRPQGGRRP